MGIPLQKALNSWISRYQDNNGIKEPNVLSLLLPLGIHHARLDTTLLADLSSYGTLRGEVAHKSNYAISTHVDPKGEYDKAAQLIRDLGKLDEVISAAITRANKLASI